MYYINNYNVINLIMGVWYILRDDVISDEAVRLCNLSASRWNKRKAASADHIHHASNK